MNMQNTNRQKRVLAIHDISGVGKCSLTVALPIISAAGVECSVLPTAILSTHTGGFTGYTYRDLTDDITPIVNHWASLGVKFDVIYTGFLGSAAQIDLVADAITRLKSESTKVIVDPVMADGGSLYSIFAPEYPSQMLKLCRMADVILPNITEASLLCGKEYREPPFSVEYINEYLSALTEVCGGDVILTGVAYNGKTLGAASSENGKYSFAMDEKIEGDYHGTGDVFGSVIAAGLALGHPLELCASIAVKFTVSAIRRTKEANSERRYGVNFEAGLSGLLSLFETEVAK